MNTAVDYKYNLVTDRGRFLRSHIRRARAREAQALCLRQRRWGHRRDRRTHTVAHTAHAQPPASALAPARGPRCPPASPTALGTAVCVDLNPDPVACRVQPTWPLTALSTQSSSRCAAHSQPPDLYTGAAFRTRQSHTIPPPSNHTHATELKCCECATLAHAKAVHARPPPPVFARVWGALHARLTPTHR